jgi:integrase
MAATEMVEVGTNVKTGQKRMGHSSSKVFLDTYARVTKEADRRAAEAVGAYLRPHRAHGAPAG